ncbi:MAG TPA: helix-turn-helix domain-containing protein [Patescibacteria group bacterium]|nr:helix-turn-helix domain-containing protein [Patescibacteria group bacterium]
MSASNLFRSVEVNVNGYYPGLLPSLKCGLAVFGAMSLAGRTKPLSIIFEGTSGYGKSAVVEMFFPEPKSTLANYAYRSDEFTPRSFVSHIAGTSRAKLSRTDLLPRLKDKVLVTKELSTIFRGREEELRDNFRKLIPILDGKGFVSDSGSQGRRGYEESIVFNWIGATTPLPRETYRVMYQLGTRLLFYEVPGKFPSEEETWEYAKRDDVSEASVVCQRAVNEFLIAFFDEHPVGTVAPRSIELPDLLLRELNRWARLVAEVRSGVKYEKHGSKWAAVAANHPEGPWKLITYFKELMRGHALIHGRDRANEEDLTVVAHTALSSLPGQLRPILRELRVRDYITTTDVRRLCEVSHPTARDHLEELALGGVILVEKGKPPKPDTGKLAPAYQWLQQLPLKAKRGGEVGEEEMACGQAGS